MADITEYGDILFDGIDEWGNIKINGITDEGTLIIAEVEEALRFPMPTSLWRSKP